MANESVSMADQEKASVDRATAIVLVPATSEHDVVRQLAQQPSWRVIAQSDAIAALVDLALTHQARLTRCANETNGSTERIAFILCYPQQWDHRERILSAIHKFFPDVEVFAYDSQSLQPIRSAQRPHAQDAARPVAPRATMNNPPQRSAETAKATGDPAITRAEIEMLLDGSSSDDASTKAGGRT